MEPFDINKILKTCSDPFWIDDVVIDSRQVFSKNTLFIGLKGKRQEGSLFALDAAKRGAKGVIVQKGIQIPELPKGTALFVVDDPLATLQEIAKSYRQEMKIPVLSIGGAVGKTLVKDLLSELLRKSFFIASSPESFNSQIGVPLSLLTIKKGDRFALIEGAISKPGEIEQLQKILEPDYCLLTPLEPLPPTSFSKEDWKKEWLKLVSGTKKWSLLPFSHPSSFRWDHPSTELPHAALLDHRPVKEMPYAITFPSGRYFQGTIRGSYSYFLNLVNMAIKSAFLLGLPEEAIEEGVRAASVELMRTEIFKAATGTTILNASYSSDPQSVALSLRHLSSSPDHHEKHFLFGGLKGEGRQEALRTIGETILSTSIDRLSLYGARDFSPLLEVLKNGGFKKEIATYPSLEVALNHLKKSLFHDQTILLKGPSKIPLERVIEQVNESQSHNLCLIHLAALRHNLSLFRSIAPTKRFLVMVKAQGYGTDDWQLARFLDGEGIDFLGVSYVDEAVSLKRAGIKQEIFVLNAAPYEADKVARWDLQVGVGDVEILRYLSASASKLGKKLKVHLHVDTGMSRFGCRPREALRLAESIQSDPYLLFEGMMTHLSAAEDPREDPFTLKQIEIFQNVRRDLEGLGYIPKWVHLSNSAALLRFPHVEENMVRLGLSIFGLHPSPQTVGLPLTPAISLQSKIVAINQCEKGSAVSYGRSYIVQKDETKIAVLPIGYYDGLHRHYSGKGHVVIRGQKAPMVGKICMDYMMVDVTDVEGVTVGDPVLLFGSDDYGHVATPEAFSAFSLGDIHELVTCLGPRIPRIFIEE
jgi:alanine racemase/UDP-N-acetylmuramoyl-tripeptide--D-alanyl-D-alanine ligase